MKSLWGEEFTVEKTPEKAKKIIKKLDNKNISEIKKIPKSKNSSVSLTLLYHLKELSLFLLTEVSIITVENLSISFENALSSCVMESIAIIQSL